MTPEPGWLKRQLDRVHEEVRHWPQYMKGKGDYSLESDIEREQKAEILKLEERLKELERQLQLRQTPIEDCTHDPIFYAEACPLCVDAERDKLSTQVRDLEQRVTVLDAGWATCGLVYKESQKEVDRLTAELAAAENRADSNGRNAAEFGCERDALTEEVDRLEQQIGKTTTRNIYLEALRSSLEEEVDRLTVELREAATLMQVSDALLYDFCREIVDCEPIFTHRNRLEQWLTRYGRKG